MVTYYVKPMEEIEVVAKKLVGIANATDEIAQAKFNDVALSVHPRDAVEGTVQQYWAKVQRP